MTNEELNYWAGIYKKLKPFIRVFNGRVYWRPAQDIAFAPTFEDFMARKDTLWGATEGAEIRKSTGAARGGYLPIQTMYRAQITRGSKGAE